ncbi:MAG: septum formation initiator family protein [bacterium]|nr:septum formation initiator family protein [bacterium]
MLDYLEKIKTFIKKYQLDDVRTIGLMVFCFIVLAVTWSGAKAVQLNYALQKRVATIEQQNDVLQLENETQKLKNGYYNTDEFKELEARRVLGRAAPGESVYIVPEKVAIANLKLPEMPPEEAAEAPVIVKSRTQQNMQDWLDFFLGRSL